MILTEIVFLIRKVTINNVKRAIVPNTGACPALNKALQKNVFLGILNFSMMTKIIVIKIIEIIIDMYFLNLINVIYFPYNEHC